MLYWLPLGLCAGVAVLSLAYVVKLYAELHRWARVMQRGGIAIGYKNRVQMEAPLVELAGWIDQLRDDEAKGRVIYTNRGVRVALLRDRKPAVELVKPKPWSRLAGRVRARRAREAAPA